MKRLYVGCRVRIVAAANFPEMIGTETRIVGQGDGWSHVHRRLFAGWLLDCRNPDGLRSCATSEQLEPIQDPGHQVISWADMADLWTPSGVEA